MKLAIVVLACLAVANATTHAVWLHGHDDGQWHGEGLLESQDWHNHHHLHGAALVTPHAAIVAPVAHAVVAHHGLAHHGLAHHGLAHHGLAHSAIIAHGHHGGWIDHHHHW